MSETNIDNDRTGLEIAVTGMAGRFPGARNIHELWENLKNGVESLSFFSDEELEQSGVIPRLLENNNYIKGRGILADFEYFDSSFFGYTPKEAELLDPQVRICLESAFHALEEAGYNPYDYDGAIGFYAGASGNLGWEIQPFLSQNDSLAGQFNTVQLTDKDFLSVRVAYTLNLKGPVINLSTTCSTSLVAIDMACRGLLTGQCDMALAGGVTVSLPVRRGYLYQEGMVMSASGHVRVFDSSANGTNGGDGVAMVVLKTLEDAIAHGDYIHAVIKGSEVNNDGNRKVGFQAPSVEGQAEVIRAALHIAEVEAESIGYVEAHGTGTPLGDPVEIEALTRAFATGKKQFCGIGSVKANVGHLDSAAGVTGFIKAVLTLKHRQIPPSIHFETPNPKIDFENSPFYVNNRLREWPEGPRRALVSSFGIGGTNAHVVLEEWHRSYEHNRSYKPHKFYSPLPGKIPSPGGEARSEGVGSAVPQLILLSAKTPSALDTMTADLIDYLKENPDLEPADAAYTLQAGRKAFAHRRMCVCSGVDEAVEVLSSPGSGKVHTFHAEETERPVVFMFPGQGAQYVNMGRNLYKSEPLFRREMDHCFGILAGLVDYDLKEILYPDSETGEAGDLIYRQDIIQPLMFVFEYSLARLTMKWGIEPYAMIGYSIGEYVAACLSGVFSLEDALTLIALRGKLMRDIPGGSMLSVPLSEGELKPLISPYPGLSIAVVNGPSCIVSGCDETVGLFEQELKKKKILCLPLSISHAGHSQMMEPMLKEFEAAVRPVPLNVPELPYISNLTGTWIRHEDAVDPMYWVKQLRYTVRFAAGLKELLKEKNTIFVEVGPGADLSTTVRQHEDLDASQAVLNTTRFPQQELSDVHFLLNRLGRLWLYGVSIDWQAFHAGLKRKRLPLPLYPFERLLYPATVSISQESFKKPAAVGKRENISDWFYLPQWKVSLLPDEAVPTAVGKLNWLLLGDESAILSGLAGKLERQARTVILVNSGSEFSKRSDRGYTIDPGREEDYTGLFETLKSRDFLPDRVVHLWGIMDRDRQEGAQPWLKSVSVRVYHSLIYLVRAISGQTADKKTRITVVSSNMQGVTGDDLLYPEKALLLGPVKVIPKEYPGINCRSIDFSLNGDRPAEARVEQITRRLYREVMSGAGDPFIAYRGNHRFMYDYEPVSLNSPKSPTPRLKQKGVYLITGGLGGIGLTLAEYLVRTVQARLGIIEHFALPPKEEWRRRLEKQDNSPEENSIDQKIKKLVELEELGGEIEVFSADVSDKQQVQEALLAAENKFGKINGVLHAAGVSGGTLIHRVTPEEIDRVFKSKVNGTLVLAELIGHTPLDFFVLCSSFSSVLGSMGEVAYCAANVFLDAFAHHKSSEGKVLTTAINWDTWQQVGMGIRHFNEDQLRNGLLPVEGVEVFRRVLAASTPQVVVSAMDMTRKFELAETFGHTHLLETYEELIDSRPKHARPGLSIPYAPPESELERVLCDTWENFLGIEQVGIHDNFFELGATSLGIVQVTAILKEIMKKDIPVLTMYAHPTVQQLAGHLDGEVEESGPHPEESAQLEAMTKGKNKLKQRKNRLSTGG